MTAKTKNIKLDVENWKIRVDERSRNRMKIQIKLSKDESLGYKHFAEVCKPAEVSDADFMKIVFFTGMEALNQQIVQQVQEFALNNKEELASSGITVIEGEDGDVSLSETSSITAD
tara:strand:+ start:6795 stop:7142 length:348 start_codon:yes stop_codon:yes gene_type:complete